MTWIHTDDVAGATRHAGYLLARLADGTIPTYRVGKLLAERPYADSRNGDDGGWQGPERDRPDERPAYLVPACECGWYGPDLPYGDGQDPAAAWRDHAAAALTATVPADHRQALDQLAGQLAELAAERPRAALSLVRQLQGLAELLEPLAVAGALAHRVTWDTIGTDLGQSRQAVSGRYRTPSASLTSRVHRLTGNSVETLLTHTRKPGSPPPGIHTWTAAVQHLSHQPTTDENGSECPEIITAEVVDMTSGEITDLATAAYTTTLPGDSKPTTITPSIRRRTERRTGEKLIVIRGLAPLVAARIDAITDEGNRLHTLTSLDAARIILGDQESDDWQPGQTVRRRGRVRTTYTGTRDLPVAEILDIAEQLHDQLCVNE